ncbi:MAG TPA: phosphatidate cytidylyltransferase [Actinomycetota bacterium]|nr:phosphatidate cytidylyltransferase [Actinomycetota bacterium]
MAEPNPSGAEPGAPIGSGIMASSRNLPQAIATAAVLLLLVVGGYALGPDVFFWLAAAVILLALLELLAALRSGGRRPVIPFAMLCALGGLLAAYFRPDRPELLLLVAGIAAFGSMILMLRPRRGSTPGSDTAWTLLSVLWIGGGGAAAVSILALSTTGNSRLGMNFLVAHVLITACDDVTAYFIGTRWGRHKLAPAISPGKSWEGLAAGSAVALGAGALSGALIGELGVLNGLAIGLIDSVFAPAGDLTESAVKRELGIKDSGYLLPGHGGFLDRLDAIVFCCPAVLVYLRFVVL